MTATTTSTVATVTTSCYRCLATIRVPLEVFDRGPVATCRDAGGPCTQPAVPR